MKGNKGVGEQSGGGVGDQTDWREGDERLVFIEMSDFLFSSLHVASHCSLCSRLDHDLSSNRCLCMI